MSTPEEREVARAEREAERARLWADATTRMPRVVRLTANEARTLDPDPMRKQNYKMNCGHLPVFEDNHPAMRRCSVVDCKYEVEDMDFYDRQTREEEYKLELRRKIRNLVRWNWAGAVLIGVAFVLGKWIV